MKYPPVEGLRERKKKASRDAMHKAALELVAERGLAQVTVDQIAERAGVSPRTLFNYWGSKEGVVLGVDPEAQSVLVDILRDRPLDEDPRDSMRLILHTHLMQATPDRSIRKLKRDVLRREPHLAQIVSNRNNDVRRILIDVLSRRLESQYPEDVAHDLASIHVFWCFAMSRATYSISMRRDIDLLEALPVVIDHVESGRISF